MPVFESRLGIPGRFFPLSEQAVRKWMDGWMDMYKCTILYECDYKMHATEKDKINKKSGNSY